MLRIYQLTHVYPNGAGKVSAALRSLLDEFAFKPAPYPNSTDLVRRFREVAGPEHQQLITDPFERITLYDVKVTDVRSKQRADGRWDVTLEVDAGKLYADGKGKETGAPLDEAFDVGVFAVKPGDKGYSKDSVLALERRRLRSGRQTFTLVTEEEPKYAGGGAASLPPRRREGGRIMPRCRISSRRPRR